MRNGRLITAILATALSVSSTAAAAQAVRAAPMDPWLALTAMNGSSPAVATAAATTAQSQVGETARANAGFSAPPVPALAVILATLAVAVYILATNPADEGPPGSPS